MKADEKVHMKGNDLCRFSSLMKAELIFERNRWKTGEVFFTLAQWPGNSVMQQDSAGVDVAQVMVPIWKNLSMYKMA